MGAPLIIIWATIRQISRKQPTQPHLESVAVEQIKYGQSKTLARVETYMQSIPVKLAAEETRFCTIDDASLRWHGIDGIWPPMSDEVDYSCCTSHNAIMWAVVDRQFEGSSIAWSWTIALYGTLSMFLSTRWKLLGSSSRFGLGAFLEPVEEGLQIVHLKGAPDHDCLRCVSSPEESTGIATQIS